jgi:hypothetical protein
MENSKGRVTLKEGTDMLGLSDTAIRERSHAYFKCNAHERVSGEYSFVPTYIVGEDMKRLDWYPYSVRDAAVRSVEKIGYSRHIVRFRHRDYLDSNGKLRADSVVPEIVMTNGHDGYTKLQVHAGIHVRHHGNFLILSDKQFLSAQLIHRHYRFEEIEAMIMAYVKSFPSLAETIQEFKDVTLNLTQKTDFARDAISIRWSKVMRSPVVFLQNMVTPKEITQSGDDLWSIFNVVSANLFSGGIDTGRTITVKRKKGGTYTRRVKTRHLESIVESVRVNKALWNLAMKFAKASISV